MRPILDPGPLSLGQDYSVFPTISPTRKGYASQRPGELGGALCLVSTKSSLP
jgi:hypothetical protein